MRRVTIGLGLLIILAYSTTAGSGGNREAESETQENQREATVGSAVKSSVGSKERRGNLSGLVAKNVTLDSLIRKELATPKDAAITSTTTSSQGVFQIGDFSVAISSVDREEKTAKLHFAVKKVKNTGSEIKPLAVTLTDDHENNYRGELEVVVLGGFPMKLIPVGFEYVKATSITIPKPAPIETIQLGDMGKIPLNQLKVIEPEFRLDLGHTLLERDKPISVGKFLVFTFDGIAPDLYTWAIAATIENKDYNQLSCGITCLVQFADGTIELPRQSSVMKPVAGLSKDTVQLALESLRGKDTPQPRSLLRRLLNR